MSSSKPLAAAFVLAAIAAPSGARAATPVLVADFTEWDTPPSPNPAVSWLDTDTDGTVWFTEQLDNGVAHLDPQTNVLTEWPAAAVGTATDGIAADGLGHAYFTTPPPSIGPSNTIERVDLATNDFTSWTLPDGSVPGAFLIDYFTGKVFFTEFNVGRIARLDPATSVMTEWAIPSASSEPEDIVVAPSGLVYFVEDATHRIGELDPTTGDLREWAVPAAGAAADRMLMRLDPSNGDVWVSLANTNQVQRLRPSTSTITRWAAPTVDCPAGGAECYAYGVDVDAQGRAWFSDYVGIVWMLDPSEDPGVSAVVAPASTTAAPVTTTLPMVVTNVAPTVTVLAPHEACQPPVVSGAFTGWRVPTAGSGPVSLRLDADGDAWYANYGIAGVGRLAAHLDSPPSAAIAGVAPALVGASITLDGSGSADPEHEALTYQWSLAAPAGSAAALSDATVVAPTFTVDVGGAYVATLVVTDACGLASAPATVTVQVTDPCHPDVTPPVITCAAPAVVQCTSPAGASSQVGATATDACSAPVVTGNALPVYPLGVTPLAFMAVDGAGNGSGCATSVTVVDTTPPAITCPADETLECAGPFTLVSLGAPMASDTCSPDVTITDDLGNGEFPGTGVALVTFTATDGSGNASSCDTAVTVEDTTPPTVVCAQSVHVACAPAGGAPAAEVPLVQPVAVDTCSGALPTTAAGLLPVYPIGDTTITYSAVDPSGNAASCTTTVAVTAAAATQIQPEPISLWPLSESYVTITLAQCIATVSDACNAGLSPATVAAGAHIVAFGSDEPNSVPGASPTSDDLYPITKNSFKARPVRLSSRNGRVYTVTYDYTNPEGVLTTASCKVAVPLVQNGPAIDDGFAKGWSFNIPPAP